MIKQKSKLALDVKLLVGLIFATLAIFFFTSSFKTEAHIKPFVIIGGPTSSGDIPIESSDVDILVNPEFPAFFTIPTVGDVATRKKGIAVSGSTPSFEVRVKTDNFENLEIKSVDLIDTLGQTHKNLSFNVLKIPDSQNKIILTLSIPDDLGFGDATFTLNINNGTALSGVIQIVESFETFTLKNNKEIGKPKISKVAIRNKRGNLTINVSGSGFSPQEIYYKKKNIVMFSGDKDSPNTTITVLPTDLGAIIKKISVKKTKIKASFQLEQKITKKTNAIIVVATGSGIDSHIITLTP